MSPPKPAWPLTASRKSILRSPALATRTMLPLINALALSVRLWSPTVRAMTDHNFAKWSQQTTQHPMCGPTPLTGPRLMKPGLQPMAGSAVSTARSQRASHDQNRFVQPTEPSRRYGRELSKSLRSKRRIWGCSSVPSVSSVPRPRSRSLIWHTICSA